MTTYNTSCRVIEFQPFYTNGETSAQFLKRTKLEKVADFFGDGLVWYGGQKCFASFAEAQGYIIGRVSVASSCWAKAAKTRVAKVTRFSAKFIDTIDQQSGEEVK